MITVDEARFRIGVNYKSPVYICQELSDELSNIINDMIERKLNAAEVFTGKNDTITGYELLSDDDFEYKKFHETGCTDNQFVIALMRFLRDYQYEALTTASSNNNFMFRIPIENRARYY